MLLLTNIVPSSNGSATGDATLLMKVAAPSLPHWSWDGCCCMLMGEEAAAWACA